MGEQEQAGIWQRVSTGGQDEASQLPDLVRWCDGHSYGIAAKYVLHGKSASKGKQDSYLDQVIRDMEDSKITVLQSLKGQHYCKSYGGSGSRDSPV